MAEEALQISVKCSEYLTKNRFLKEITINLKNSSQGKRHIEETNGLCDLIILIKCQFNNNI